MDDNKKTLVLSIVGVLVLILVVVGVSYAMYTFTGTGKTQNTITTGSISVTIDPAQGEEVNGVTINKQTITLTNQYPMTDDKGVAQAEVLRFYVSSTVSGSTKIGYDIGMEKETVEGTALADSDVKMQLKKATGIGALAAVTGRDQVLVSSFASQGGSLDNTTVTSYFLDHGEFTESGIVTYEMKIWVDADYVLPTTDVTDEDETDGLTHSNTTTSASYAFKIKAYAAQVL